jgi:taurine dioxygenase
VTLIENPAIPDDLASYETIRVEPLTPRIGAEISGVRMSGDLSDEQIGEIRRALLAWKVVFLRDQEVTVEEHIAFGRRFGDLEVHPFAPDDGEHPEIVAIHHDASSKHGQNNWHSDVTWRLQPSLGSILRARIVPSVGGDTHFADMEAAYDALSDDIKAKIDGKTATHSFVHTFGRRMTPEQREQFLVEYPEPHHPVVRTHPETGRRSLYVNMAFTLRIDDMDPAESAQLLPVLYRQADNPERQCRFRWRRDSVAFWDNRAVQHFAAFDYHPATRRVERVTVVGDTPS